ncbi:MAG: hypothetical protein J6Y48_20915 [Clostridia bacterium]|nr:hypothetical protein [Clostridia bacterium]
MAEYDWLVLALRERGDRLREPVLYEAADAIEERDRYALTLQHEMMAEAESHIALVERLNKQIKELELHYCPHAIRNVHDRGDDSLCRVLGAEPPEEEA